MDAKVSTIREKLLDHISPWVTGGMLLALTGAAPEDWVSRCAHILGASNSYSYIRSVGIDLRVVPVAIGVLVIVVHTLLQQRRRTAARFANQTAPNALSLESPSETKEILTSAQGSHTGLTKADVDLTIWAGYFEEGGWSASGLETFTALFLKSCFEAGFYNCKSTYLNAEFSVIRHWGVPRSFADEVKLLADRTLATYGVVCDTKLVKEPQRSDGTPAITFAVGKSEVATLRATMSKRAHPPTLPDEPGDSCARSTPDHLAHGLEAVFDQFNQAIPNIGYDWGRSATAEDIEKLQPGLDILYEEHSLDPSYDRDIYERNQTIRVPELPVEVSPRGFVKLDEGDWEWIDPRNRNRRICRGTIWKIFPDGRVKLDKYGRPLSIIDIVDLFL